ncbi:MAG TPA: metallophosphoesterase family protein [Candidatus Nitrosotenuis sp.]|nr:metallophosphoesterase family protein [Candidatus Nitrosotenuis sp.]
MGKIELAIKMHENERRTGLIANGSVRGPLIKLKVPDKLVIIGDLHGDTKSLFSILQEISFREFLSNPGNKLVFLGDYIDRGSDSAGILQMVCHLKRKYPDSLVLLCGNHEAVERFDFAAHNLPDELRTRYGPKSRHAYEKLLSLFRLFAKVVIIEDQLLLVHGGVPTSINQTDFFESVIKDEDDTVEELLWNDPRSDMPNNEDWCKSRRNFGRHFGKNISQKYLAFTQTKVIVRGHEPCHGFKTDHDNMVLTLFSSKEAYPKFDAAYLSITKEELTQVRNAADLAKYVKKIKNGG